MKNLNIDVVEHHGSSVEISSDGYVYVSAEVEFGLIPETPIYIEAQLVCMKDEAIVSTSEPYAYEVVFDSPRVSLSDSFHAGTDQIPNSYAINFRTFTPEEACEIDTPIPPEIARQSGAYLIHTPPKKGLLSREKWVSGSVSIESIIVKNVAGEDDAVFANLASTKPSVTGFKLTCTSGESNDYTLFKIFEKPQTVSDHLRLHLTDDLTINLIGYAASDWTAGEKTQIATVEHSSSENDDEERGYSDTSNEDHDAGDIPILREGTRYFMVNTGSAGGEITIGTISKEFVEHWSSADSEELLEVLSEINSESDDIDGPSITEDGNRPFYDLDDIEHTTAPYDDNHYEVDEVVPDADAQDGYRFIKSVCKGEYNRLYGRERYSEPDDGSEEIVPILTFHNGEKGTFGRLIIETDGDFDPNKLCIGVMETDVGDFIDSYWYDGQLIEPDYDWDSSRSNFSSATVGYLSLTDYGLKENYAPGSELIKELFDDLNSQLPSADSTKSDVSRDEADRPEPSSISKSAASNSVSSWIVANAQSQNENTKDLHMTITRFESEAPDEDGDISVDLEFEIKNESDKDISLIKYDVVVDQDEVGTIGGQTRNTEDCLLDSGEVFSGSTWLRLNENSMDKGNSEVNVKLYARVYEREFFKIGSMDVPADANSMTSITKEIDSELLDSSITVSMVRRPDGDEDSKEDRLEFKAGFTNKSDTYIEDLELRVVLMDRTGAEDDDTYDSLDTLSPQSGTYIEPSFWGKPKSKLKGATVDVFLKAHRLIGIQVISETRTLSN